MNRGIRFIELFAGIGGFRYGLERAGEETLQQADRCRGAESNTTPISTDEEQSGEYHREPTEEGEGDTNTENCPGKVGRLQQSMGQSQSGQYIEGDWERRPQFTCVWANEWDKYASQIYRARFASNGEQQGDTEIGRRRGSVSNKGKQSNQSKEWGNHTNTLTQSENQRPVGNAEERKDNQLQPVNSGGYWHEPSKLYEGDIRTVDPASIPEHDLIVAGFPCQSFSIAGKRGGFEDTRGTLFFEICRIARAKRTPYLLLENVKGLLSHDEGNTFRAILQTLDEMGYDCQWQVLNSKNFGVPQNRERVFIIGHLRGQPRPQVFPLGETDQVYTEPDRQISHAIDSNYHKGWLDNQQRTMVRTRSDQHYQEKEVTPPHQSIRRLTPTECERLQGFPDGWTKDGLAKDGEQVAISDTQRYKCLGNAVTTNVITAIGERLLG
jgi:DNA (cytosine-5)-methyltransferase 1